MSATFNWAYRPGVANKYGVSVPNTSDDAAASTTGISYVALFGNDDTGNGSRKYPYRTITQAINQYYTTIIVASGVYREGDLPTSQGVGKIIGDGNVVIDLTLNTGFFLNDRGGDVFYYNLYFRGQGATLFAGPNTSQLQDCTFDGVLVEMPYGGAHNIWGAISNCIFINSWLYIDYQTEPKRFINNTFYNSDIYFANSSISAYGYALSLVFHSCNIHFADLPSRLDFCLFYQCNFRLTANNPPTVSNLYYPFSSDGFIYYGTIIDLTNAINSAFGSSNVLAKCIISDPMFNNEEIGDFTLAFNSPAKNLSYFGTYVGARSIGQSIKVAASESDGQFEFDSAINLTIADDSITLIDSSIDAQIDTKVIVNLSGRELASLPSYGFNADRNGQYIDSIADLSESVYNQGDTLSEAMPFLVENAAIVYNGNTYQPGERTTTIAGADTFTTSADGVIREILEAPQRHTIMARFSNGGSAITAGDALVDSYYYYVASGTVTYNSIDQASGTIFKASGTAAFSGSGNVVIAFADESFQHYEPGIQPTSNNTGDTRTGAILRGNGDPAYVRGGLGVQEFPINAKFIQIRYYIRVNNLKP